MPCRGFKGQQLNPAMPWASKDSKMMRLYTSYYMPSIIWLIRFQQMKRSCSRTVKTSTLDCATCVVLLWNLCWFVNMRTPFIIVTNISGWTLEGLKQLRFTWCYQIWYIRLLRKVLYVLPHNKKYRASIIIIKNYLNNLTKHITGRYRATTDINKNSISKWQKVHIKHLKWIKTFYQSCPKTKMHSCLRWTFLIHFKCWLLYMCVCVPLY